MTASYAGGSPIVEIVRSGFVEGHHHASAVVLDADGRVTIALGDVAGAILPRSANKPMQAAAMLRSGLELRDDRDLALVAASHGAEPEQVERIRAMLTAGELSETDLRCPPDYPISPEVRATAPEPLSIMMNCSGKHTGMLLTCLAAGWSTQRYLEPDHPLQRACVVELAGLAQEPVERQAVDGCGAPALAISLTGLARALLHMVEADPGSPERRVADAMRCYPELVSYHGAPDARLMATVPSLLAKAGAEGVVALALPGRGAVAVKIDDGAMRARMPVAVGALRQLGVRGAVLDELAETPVLGGGRKVGSVRLTTGGSLG